MDKIKCGGCGTEFYPDEGLIADCGHCGGQVCLECGDICQTETCVNFEKYLCKRCQRSCSRCKAHICTACAGSFGKCVCGEPIYLCPECRKINDGFECKFCGGTIAIDKQVRMEVKNNERTNDHVSEVQNGDSVD